MFIRIILILANALLINLGFLFAFLIRYGLPFPEYNFILYKKSFVFLTLIEQVQVFVDLFKRVFCGLFLGTLLSVAFVYAFRSQWSAFPTSIFILSFFINLLVIFKANQQDWRVDCFHCLELTDQSLR